MRQPEAKAAALPERTAELQIPLVQLNNAAHKGQAQAYAGHRPFRAHSVVVIEDRPMVLGFDAAALVAHRNADPARLAAGLY